MKYPLIVTTNYDDVLEAALQEASEPFDLLYYETKGENIGKSGTSPPGQAPFDRQAQQVPRPLDRRRTIVLKIHGL